MSTIGELKAVWSDPVLSTETYLNVDSHWTVAETVRKLYHDMAITANKENSSDNLDVLNEMVASVIADDLVSLMVTFQPSNNEQRRMKAGIELTEALLKLELSDIREKPQNAKRKAKKREAKMETGVKESGVKGVEATNSRSDAPEPSSLEKLWERMNQMEAERGAEIQRMNKMEAERGAEIQRMNKMEAERGAEIQRMNKMEAERDAEIQRMNKIEAEHGAEIQRMKDTSVRQERIIARHARTIVGLNITITKHKDAIAGHKAKIAEHDVTIARHVRTIEMQGHTISQQETTTRSLHNELKSVKAEHQDQMDSLRKLTMMLIPLHLRHLLDLCRNKVMAHFSKHTKWREFQGDRTTTQLSDDVFKGLAGVPKRPSHDSDTIMFLCSYSDVRRNGDKAAHSGSIDEIKTAIRSKKLNSRERRYIP
ncbi:hypothetical protein BU15DRAFT_78774 [Melanogaster broomeanus]|nr:hypothetical protein BU15DRAFT_78774 [Melanogaster broomeanus]